MTQTPEPTPGHPARFEPSAEFSKQARIGSFAEYQRLYQESINEPERFFRRELSELPLRSDWKTLVDWQLPHAKWFSEATLNVSESCLDRHLNTAVADQRALIWEGEPGEVSTLTYRQLHQKVVQFAAALRKLGIKSGDRVAIYMGMVPEVVIAMLACARIGAPHSVVFGGFAAESLQGRINDCEAKLVITQDAAWRRGKPVPLKQVVDKALLNAPSVQKVIVLPRLGAELSPITMQPGRDITWEQALADVDVSQGQAEVVPAEHPLFILYTSGSTGKPKGVLHTSLGYLAGAHITTKYVFDLKPNDVYWCTADVGWITGHSYLVYGPLSNGATCVMYEGAPNFPDWGRFWQIIDKHQITILYTAPTAIRAFIKAGDEWPAKADLSSLRLLGSVGEPINPEAWLWYHEKIGKARCPIVDTWWQTETGSIMLTTLPGAMAGKPSYTGMPFFGVRPELRTELGGPVPAGESGVLVLTQPWPSMLRTIWGDDERFNTQYFSQIPGVYFAGDGASIDSDGYFQVVGRIDDVLKLSGHRVGTAEIESSLVGHNAVAEAAAVGRPDDIRGQALVVFVTLKPGAPQDEATRRALIAHVEEEVGKFARPDEIRFADALPKTRSGKIMRRLLKDIAAGKDVQGDLSTLEDAQVIQSLRGANK
ncbi:MAG TPA: acetate--CoA ligase [Polyangiaceae bacterium]|nr:acetate--CoA ligase [Polyangiaceae bacterium]